jgi:dolichol-phosphate mannosyltransferase
LISDVKKESTKEKVVIIIPTYNEASVIENTLFCVFKAIRLIEEQEIHVLIFDSSSLDNTQQIIIALQKKYHHLHLQSEMKKSGLGSAYRQAMDFALNTLYADIIIEFDADLSHQPKYIRPILNQLSNSDCVVGSRYIKGGSIPKDWAMHRKLFSLMGNWVARAVLTRQYKDFTSGFRATRAAALKKILPQSFLSDHYAYKLQLMWLLHRSEAVICEYPIEFIDRTNGESKLPKNSIPDSLRVIFTLRYNELKQYFNK